ncbi:MAG TPA: M1 family metallopeptidase [Syntrophomonadaceae bacterium]|nr:M1 family metallopeptidase [Syntrophomonadaceae bacterium]
MKKYRFYFISIIIGVFCAGYFIYMGQVDNHERSSLVLAEAENTGENLFPSPEKTLYQMSLYLDVHNKNIYGNTLLKTENTSEHILEELWFTAYPNAFTTPNHSPAPKFAYYDGFDEAWLEFSQIVVNGTAAEHKIDGVAVQVILQESISPDEPIVVEMQWMAKIPKVAYRYGTKNNVFMLGNFYPILNVLGDEWHKSYNSAFGDPFCSHTANYVVNLNTPEAYDVAATGISRQEIAEDNGRQIHIIEALNARDFSLAVMYNYQELNKTLDQTEIKAYLPSDKIGMGESVLKESADILDYYSSKFGVYPYEEFKIVYVPMQGFQGMEYSGLIFLKDEFLRANYDRNHREVILAHEISHQWWYGMVGNDQIKEPWLDEGLANWSAYKYLQDVKGQKIATSGASIKGVKLNKELGDIYSLSEYFHTAYSGGEAFWFGLEAELGTDKVFKILNRYLATFKYKIATTADLLEIIREESGQDMEEYFARWFK